MKRRSQIGGQFIAHRREMRESAAWRALTWNARRVLDRLELEHMAQGGEENGRLICTYAQFKAAGLRGPSIALAINECVALGFLEVTKRGTPSISCTRNPSTYRLTYIHGRGKNGAPSDEWQRIKTDDEAAAALASAKAIKSAPHVRRARALARAGSPQARAA